MAVENLCNGAIFYPLRSRWGFFTIDECGDGDGEEYTRQLQTKVMKRGTLNQNPQTDGNAGVFPGNDQKYDQFKIYKGFLKVVTRFKVPKMDCTDTRVEAFWKEERGFRIGRGKDGGKWQ